MLCHSPSSLKVEMGAGLGLGEIAHVGGVCCFRRSSWSIYIRNVNVYLVKK